MRFAPTAQSIFKRDSPPASFRMPLAAPSTMIPVNAARIPRTSHALPHAHSSLRADRNNQTDFCLPTYFASYHAAATPTVCERVRTIVVRIIGIFLHSQSSCRLCHEPHWRRLFRRHSAAAVQSGALAAQIRCRLVALLTLFCLCRQPRPCGRTRLPHSRRLGRRCRLLARHAVAARVRVQLGTAGACGAAGSVSERTGGMFPVSVFNLYRHFLL